MRILYVSQYYPPEMGAPAARVSELARHWAGAGHNVTVLTGFPNHPDGVVPDEWKRRLRRLVWSESIDGVNVIRTWLYPAANRGAFKRMANYASFCVSAVIRGLFLQRPDIIIASSPQLLVGLSGACLSWAKKCPWIFEVRDLWPESLEAVGAATSNSLLYKVLERIAGFLYAHASHIVVVSPAFVDCLTGPEWQLPANRLSVVTNGVETSLFDSEGETTDAALTPELDGKLFVSYVGTVGMAHGVGTVLDCAERLRERDDIVFLIVGEGAERAALQSSARERGLSNVRFLGPVDRARVPAILRASSACLVLLKRSDVFKSVIPSKMLEMMACARPLILGVEGQAEAIVREADCGVCIEPESVVQLAEAIKVLSLDPGECRRLGTNGRHYILQHMSREATAASYLKILQSAGANDDRRAHYATAGGD